MGSVEYVVVRGRLRGTAEVSHGGPQRIGLDEARLVREHDCLHAVADLQLLKNM